MPNGRRGGEADHRMESCDLAVSSCVFYIIIRFINKAFQWAAVELLGKYKITGWRADTLHRIYGV